MRSSKQRIALSNSSLCISLSPASYACTAFSKCFDCVRSGAAARDEEDAAATGALRTSTFAGLVARRAGVLAAGFEPFRGDVFLDSAFKRIDLAVPDERVTAFFTALDFDLVFITMSPATYTDNAS